MRIIRSVLYVPGVRPDRFANAIASGADAVVFDLEDSVEAGRKAEARKAVGAFVSTKSEALCLRWVRVNPSGSRFWADDLAFVSALGHIDGVVLPKAESAAQVEELAGVLSSRTVIPLIETARGVLQSAAIAAADATVPALMFGAEDLTADIGIPRTLAGEELLYARSQVVLAATAAGADAIDAVWIDIPALDLLRQDAARARALGFRGKMAIHPGQISVIHEVFTPPADDIARARRIVEAYDAALAAGEGVIRLDNQMIDAPIVNRARRVLAIADAATARRMTS